jgi:hypothetical protein
LPGGHPAASIPADAATNPNLSNALKNNQRHNRCGAQTGRTIGLSPSRRRALGTDPKRRWRWNRAGPPGLAIGSRRAAGLRRLSCPARTMAGQSGRRDRDVKPVCSRICRSR